MEPKRSDQNLNRISGTNKIPNDGCGKLSYPTSLGSSML